MVRGIAGKAKNKFSLTVMSTENFTFARRNRKINKMTG